MQARYYDPVIGRMYSNDPIGASEHLIEGNIQGFNRFAYANNNPYKYTDPDGRVAVPVVVPPPPPLVPPSAPPSTTPPFVQPNEQGGSNPIQIPEIIIPTTTSVVTEIAVMLTQLSSNSGDIELETPTNSPNSFDTVGKGRNKVFINKETGVVMQENNANHGGKSYNVWRNKKRYDKSRDKRETSVWANSGKDRGR